MHVGTNEKFAAFFLSRCKLRADVPADAEVDRGIWVARTIAIDLGPWPEWLGTLTVDELQEPGLVLYATSPSRRPEVLDAEHDSLQRAVQDVFHGLTLHGVPSFNKGANIVGANVNGELRVRRYSNLQELRTASGLPPFVVGIAELQRAVTAGQRLREMQDENVNSPVNARWARLLRGVSVLLKANLAANEFGDRLHQFVRVLEALIKPRIQQSRRDFAHRAQTFVVANAPTARILDEMYDLRSHVEHVHAAMDALATGSREERIATVNLRTRQADVLARVALGRVIESDVLYETFSTDDRVDEFWRLRDDQRRQQWGERIDLRKIV